LKSVLVIEKFEDLLEVFSGVRPGPMDARNPPFPSKDTKLEIVAGLMELKDCENFVLSDRLAHRGDEFIMWCLERAIPSAKLRVSCNLDFTPPKVH